MSSLDIFKNRSSLIFSGRFNAILLQAKKVQEELKAPLSFSLKNFVMSCFQLKTSIFLLLIGEGEAGSIAFLWLNKEITIYGESNEWEFSAQFSPLPKYPKPYTHYIQLVTLGGLILFACKVQNRTELF